MADEQVDISPERQKDILDFDERAKSTNHFEVLGVSPGASPDEIRNAFHELSRKFHPDRYYGKNLGSFRQRLDRIFKRLVEANNALSDPDKRKAYLDANPFVRAAVRAATGSQQVLEAPKEKSADDLAREKERQARLARHPYFARTSKVHELLTRSKAHVAKGEFSHAFTQLNLAAQMDPNNQDVKTLLAEVRRSYDHMRSETDFKRGLEALNREDDNLAVQAFKAAVNASAANAEAASKVAEILERHNGDPKEIVSYLQKAVDADQKNVDYRLALARHLDAAGMKALAKKHIDEAARLNPDHPEVKKYVKKRWPF